MRSSPFSSRSDTTHHVGRAILFFLLWKDDGCKIGHSTGFGRHCGIAAFQKVYVDTFIPNGGR